MACPKELHYMYALIIDLTLLSFPFLRRHFNSCWTEIVRVVSVAGRICATHGIPMNGVQRSTSYVVNTDLRCPEISAFRFGLCFVDLWSGTSKTAPKTLR